MGGEVLGEGTKFPLQKTVMYGVFPTSDCLDEVQAIVCSGGQYHSVLLTPTPPSTHTRTRRQTQTQVCTQMYAHSFRETQC